MDPQHGYLADVKPQKQVRQFPVSSALPQTAASVAIAATVVGAAATLLARRTKASEEPKVSTNSSNICMSI